MNYQDLRSALTITDGSLTLARTSLGSGLSSFLEACYDGQPIIITNAALGSGDDVDQTVVITGNAAALGVENLPLIARFSIDAEGNVKALLKYQLRSADSPADSWTFAQSFPSLPTEWDYGTGFDINDSGIDLSSLQTSYLSSLTLTDATCVISTHDCQDPDAGVPLAAGINVIATMPWVQGTTGVLDYALSSVLPLTLYGVIRKTPSADPRPLDVFERAWDRTDAPGISVQAALPLSFTAGNLQFEQAAFRIYSPLSSDWLAENPSFSPLHGYSARLSIPSASLALELSAAVGWNLPGALLLAHCHGVTLGNLASLMDLAGTDSLSSLLPDELRSAVESLAQLELTSLSLTIGQGDVTPTVDSVTVTVAMPSLSWEPLGDTFQVQNLSCRFDIPAPFGSSSSGLIGSKVVTISGQLSMEGVLLDIEARSDSGFSAYAKLGSGQTIPLSQLMAHYAAGIPCPGELNVANLSVCIGPGSAYSMSMLLADSPPWQISLGPTALTISDVQATLDQVSGQTTGSFGGTLALGDSLSLAVNYNVPGELVLSSTYPSLPLTGLLSALSTPVDFLPSGFDLTLMNASIRIDARSGSSSFQLTTQVDEVGELGFQALSQNGKWGFVLGIGLNGQVSSVAGLSAIAALESILGLSELTLVAASVTPSGLSLPGVTLPQSGLVAGLNAYGKLSVGSSSGLSVLQTLLGLSPSTVLPVTLQIGADPAQNTQLLASISGSISSNVQLAGTLCARLTNCSPSLLVSGTVTMPIQGQSCVFDTTMQLSLAPPSAFLSGAMQGSIQFSGITLSNLALQVGADSAGIPSLGVAATVSVGRFSGSVAVFLDSANPAQSMLAGSISELSLQDVADSLAQMVGFTVPSALGPMLAQVAVSGTQEFSLPASCAAALDANDAAQISAAFQGANIPLPADPKQLLVVSSLSDRWFVTDLATMRHYTVVQDGAELTGSLDTQLYVAPQATRIGTLSYPQGFYLNGKLSLFGLSLTATIQISTGNGISVNTRMSPFTVVSPNFFSLGGVDDKGPRFSMSTYAQTNRADVNLRGPHLLINGKLTLLGCSSTLYISVSQSGLVFNTTLSTPVISWQVGGSFLSLSNLSASGQITVGLQSVPPLDFGPLGKVNLNTSLGGSLGLRYDGQAASATLSGSITLMGQTFSTGDVSLSVGTDTVDALPQLAANALYGAIKSYLNVAGQWAGWVKSGVMQGIAGAAQLGQVLASQFMQTGDQIGQLAKSVMGYGANDIATALRGAGQAAAAATQILKNLGYGASEIAGALKSAYSATDALASTCLKAVGYAVSDVAGVLKSLYGDTDAAAAMILRGVGFGAQEVAAQLKSLWKDTDALAATALRGAGYAVEEVGYALQKVWNSSSAAAAAALKAAGYALEDMSIALQMIWQLSNGAAAQLFQSLGYTASEVGGVLLSVWMSSDAGAARALKSAGYAADEAAGVLKSLWGDTDAAGAAALKFGGYAVAEVAGALRSVYGSTAAAAATALKAAGYLASDIGSALKAAFNALDSEVSAAMRAAGFLARDVAGVLNSVYGETDAVAAAALKAGGYMATDVAAAIGSVFYDTAGGVVVVLKNVGYAVADITAALQANAVWSVTDAKAAQLLRSAGYAAAEAAGAIHAVFATTDAAAAQVLKQAGYAAAEVASALKSVFGSADATTAQLLRSVGYATTEVAGALKAVFGSTDAAVVQLLKSVGCPIAEVGAALKSLFGTTDAAAAQLLKSAGYAAAEISAALKSAWGDTDAAAAAALKSAGYAASEIAGGIKSAYGSSLTTLAAALESAEYDATVVAGALKSVWSTATDLSMASALRSAGYDVTAAASALKSVYGEAASAAAIALRSAGYAASEVAGVLKSLWNQTDAVTAQLLKLAGYAAGDAAAALKAVWGSTDAAAAAALVAAEYAVADVASALKSVWNDTDAAAAAALKAAGAQVQQVAGALVSVYGDTAAAMCSAMHAAGFLAVDVGNSLKQQFSAAGDAGLTLLKNAGYGVTEISSALRLAWGYTDAATVAALKAVGYTVIEIATGLKAAWNTGDAMATALLQGANYTAAEIASALKAVYGDAAAATAYVLKSAGYVVNDICGALQSAYSATMNGATSALKAAGYAGDIVAGALKSVYGATATQAAGALKAATYGAVQVGSALKSVYHYSDTAAAILCKNLGYTASAVARTVMQVYGDTDDQMASAMKSAGYTVSEVASTLQSVYGDTGDEALDALKYAGYATDDIGDALESVYGWSSSQVEDAFKRIGVSIWHGLSF